MSVMNVISIAQLNSFLCGEIAAVETYHDILQKVTEPGTRATLRGCALSHGRRVQCLRDAIARMGGTPADGPGTRGTFVGLFDGGARALGGKAAISALAQGEDEGICDYRDNFWKLDQQARDLVEGVLLPAQEQTRGAMRELKKALS
jgi:Domain of unknown function (DUF2383)